MAGTATLFLYGAAVAGVGLAFAGLWRSSVAGHAALVVAVATLLVDIVVPALKLPAWLHNAALTSHYGESMLGHWNWVGVVVSLGLAVGGVAMGAWGFSRRDLKA
jgi:ABC-2 type transport system permease protein